jgi:hypothetical protein
MTKAKGIKSKKSQPLEQSKQTGQSDKVCAYVNLSANIIYCDSDIDYLNDCINSLPDGCEVVLLNTHLAHDNFGVSKVGQQTDERGRTIVHLIWRYSMFSFAQARNIALKHSTRDWILAIDADERLLLPTQDWFETLNEVPKFIGGFILGQFGFSLPEWKPESAKGFYTVETLRLFRNVEHVQWCGFAHEQVLPSLEQQGYITKKSNLMLYHLGYDTTKEQAIAKLERNVELLTRQIAVYPNEHTQFFRKLLQRDLSYLLELTGD